VEELIQMNRKFRRIFSILAILFLIVACRLIIPATIAAEERPNIVMILTDDQGWGDLSLNGNTNLSTPRIDSIAKEGAQFDRFFVCAVCSPTRAEMLTGRYHPRSGVRGTSTGQERMDLDESTIAEAFQTAGYATGAFGKWHNGTQYPYHPNARGFDEYYGFCSGHWGQYFDPILEHNGEIVRGEGFIIDDLTTHAIEFIEANQDEPFFCYVPYNTPHSPFQVPDEFYDRFADVDPEMRNRDPNAEELPKTRAALAMVENIDWNVGRILDQLDELDLAENTIVVYFADNGPNSWRWNGGMRGKKGSTDEGGVRAPCLVRWPSSIEAGTVVRHIAGAIDLLPTLTDMAGIERVGDKPLDGLSLRPLLLNEPAIWTDRMIFSHQKGKVSVRTQRYRLDANGRLYDLTEDPGQDVDLSQGTPAQMHEAAVLQREVAIWSQDVLEEIQGPDERPYPVGYPEFPRTFLPARDGIAQGGVQRSARAPNCSFYTNWTSTEDAITWDVEVATPGLYNVEIYYTCPAADVGATIELSLLGQTCSATVEEAFDPPLIDDMDRVQRGSESYVKDFRPLDMGTLDLPAGRSTLTLKATDIPGATVADVRAVMLLLQVE
jgi:arylsulfatase A-like enzyme